MTNIGERTKILPLSNGSLGALSSNTPNTGDRVVLLRDESGNLVAHKSGTAEVGGRVYLTRDESGNLVAVKSGKTITDYIDPRRFMFSIYDMPNVNQEVNINAYDDPAMYEQLQAGIHGYVFGDSGDTAKYMRSLYADIIGSEQPEGYEGDAKVNYDYASEVTFYFLADVWAIQVPICTLAFTRCRRRKTISISTFRTNLLLTWYPQYYWFNLGTREDMNWIKLASCGVGESIESGLKFVFPFDGDSKTYQKIRSDIVCPGALCREIVDGESHLYYDSTYI